MNEELIVQLREEQSRFVPLLSRGYIKTMAQVENFFVWISYEMYCRELIFSIKEESLESAHKKIFNYIRELFRVFFESDVSSGE